MSAAQNDTPFEGLHPRSPEDADQGVLVGEVDDQSVAWSSGDLLDRLLGTNKAVITLQESAVLLGISTSAARRAEAKGQIPSIRVNRRILVPVVAFRRLLGE